MKGLIQNTRQLLRFERQKQVLVNQNGKQIKAIQGVRSVDKQLITLYPGSVPSKLPNAEFWSKTIFLF